MSSPVVPATGRLRARRQRRAAVALGLAVVVTLAACNSDSKTGSTAAKTSPTTAASASSSSSASTTDSTSASAVESSSSPVASSSAPTDGKKTNIVWYVGLGGGGDPGQPAKEQKVVDAFNASQSAINLKLTVVTNANATKTLATQISGGNGPDIVGPVGVKGSNAFDGQWADMAPMMASQKFDTSGYDAAAIKSFLIDGKQVGLPSGVYPSYVWYNKDLFDEAGVEYPPAKWGDKYADGTPWNWDKLREISKKLTLDSAGKDATDPAFDSKKVVQWGYDPQFSEGDLTRWSAQNGAGSFVADDGKTAQIPPLWLEQWKRRHDMIFKDFSSPSKKQLDSDTLQKGNPFPTGKVAIVTTHLWYICCATTGSDATKNKKAQTFWDNAAMPANSAGTVTSPLHSDSFRILETSKNKEAAFTAIAYFLTTAGKEMQQIFGAMPPTKDLQDDFFTTLDKTWTQKPNWQVVKDALQYPDIPNHEANMPNFVKANERITVTATKIYSDPNLDIDAEAKLLQGDLQKIFDEKKK